MRIIFNWWDKPSHCLSYPPTGLSSLSNHLCYASYLRTANACSASSRLHGAVVNIALPASPSFRLKLSLFSLFRHHSTSIPPATAPILQTILVPDINPPYFISDFLYTSQPSCQDGSIQRSAEWHARPARRRATWFCKLRPPMYCAYRDHDFSNREFATGQCQSDR